jgi:hypothetical protein
MADGMTREEFRSWFRETMRIHADLDHPCSMIRDWADKMRPHDPELAALYVKEAEAVEAIFAHLRSKTMTCDGSAEPSNAATSGA